MTAPNGVKLEVTALIDEKVWEQMKNQGMPEKDMQKAIEKQITLEDNGWRLLVDLDQVIFQKYY